MLNPVVKPLNDILAKYEEEDPAAKERALLREVMYEIFVNEEDSIAPINPTYLSINENLREDMINWLSEVV